MGVRSNTRAILKLSGCTFTYPGRSTPSLYNVSCALSLSRSAVSVYSRYEYTDFFSRRVGVVGPNGAGKSTLIKLLTVRCNLRSGWLNFNVNFVQGETIPQEGTVYKHPALRVGYVSQHATHHIGMSCFELSNIT
jgi:elongation factor 3